MKTITELKQELLDWVKCIRFETDEEALEFYLIAYVETWDELKESYNAIGLN